ncbi:putative monooxygenase [Luteitalea pratensis]|uniref:Putative monooxygenase n=1 Tax=Luteitalea pratensis TaxID=1855912 RepID=A0A143PFG5_LUTPR|nr:FAD-dependent oxidoreductase [Luteitalea pratensis]AMY07013.1 putative monooxygenase [Luteitalea pratensis]
MQRSVDACVVGAGVAGAATALRLARGGMRVTLIEAHAPARASGDTAEVLPPAAVHALAALGVDDVWTLGGTCRGVLSRWRGDQAGFTDYELLGCTPARAVTRGTVARCLTKQAMRAGVNVITTGLVSGERARDRWSLIAGQHTERERISCRHVIDATGRSGRPIAALPVRYHHDRAVCLSTRHAGPLLDPTILLVDRSTHGWWYAIGAGEGATDVAFVTDADLLPRARQRATWLADEYREATLITQHLENSPDFGALTSRDARSGHRAAAAGEGWLAVGDAALSWDPLSGHGMRFALEGAERAAEAVLAGHDERTYAGYAQWYDDAVVDYGRARTAMYGAATTSARGSEFWRRRYRHV